MKPMLHFVSTFHLLCSGNVSSIETFYVLAIKSLLNEHLVLNLSLTPVGLGVSKILHKQLDTNKFVISIKHSNSLSSNLNLLYALNTGLSQKYRRKTCKWGKFVNLTNKRGFWITWCLEEYSIQLGTAPVSFQSITDGIADISGFRKCTISLWSPSLDP